MTRLLVTGFGPFPGVPRNPSALLAMGVARSPRLALAGIGAEALVLDTAYGEIGHALLPAVGRLKPDAILMIGVAARRTAMCVEVQALNRASRLFPDAAGQVGAGLALDPGLPLRLKSQAPAALLVRAVRGGGAPARLSRDAGRYLCNAAYLAALREHPGAVFVHVPLPRGSRPGDRRPSLRQMREALVRAALALCAGSASVRGARPQSMSSTSPGPP